MIFDEKITYIYPTESFLLFFYNIDFKLATHPKSTQSDLTVENLDNNSTYSVLSNDFLQIYNTRNELWGPGKIHFLNITGNSSKVVLKGILTCYIYKMTETTDDDDDDDDGNGSKPNEIINTTFVLMILILIIAFSSFLYVIRFQQRYFLNPKHEYIKKLKIPSEKESIIRDFKVCSNCGRPINARAKFCEHCGNSQ